MKDLLIPVSVALKVFNEIMETDCKTLEECKAYLESHPEARKKFLHRKRTPTKAKP